MVAVSRRPYRQKLATRERILEAAVDQFARHGFAHATVRHIAEHAGYSHAAVHWHFGSKSTVYAEAAKIAADRFIEAMRRSNLVDLPFPDAANTWIRQLANDTPVSWLLRSLAADHRHPAVEETAKSVNGVFRDFWQDWLRDCHPLDCRESRAEPADLAHAIVATLTGMAVVKLHGEQKPPLVSLVALARLIENP